MDTPRKSRLMLTLSVSRKLVWGKGVWRYLENKTEISAHVFFTILAEVALLKITINLN